MRLHARAGDEKGNARDMESWVGLPAGGGRRPQTIENYWNNINVGNIVIMCSNFGRNGMG